MLSINALVPYLFQKDMVISVDMKDDIKVEQTSREKIEYLLSSMKEMESG